ncbi:hypothetical protein [Agromyces sp. NPDC057865]|uniref:hypothetical protein n=1 Tax=Agromyces sp. NPDC057865 TaxID=3346267 RepID=UPI00366EDB47
MSTSELQARVAELEAENRALRSDADAAAAALGATPSEEPPARRGRGRGRTAAAIVLVVIGLLLVPVAVIAGWARLELVDTDRFVATFAPLAEDPDVQAYIADEVTAAIEEQVDIPALTADLFDGLRELNLPPRAETALGLLEQPATQGLQNLVSGVVDRIVTSDAFEDIWAAALRASHTQFIAAMQGSSDAALEIGSGGTLSVQLGPIVAAVKQRLEDQGVGFASAIPDIDRSIVVAQNDAFTLVQTVYALAVAAGTWIPWICLLLLVAGVLIAKNRPKALVWTAGGFALSMGLLAAGVGVGRLYFVGAVSPSIMPRDAAESLFDGLVELMISTILALFVLALLVAVIAWFSGPWRPARAARDFAGSGFSAVRRSAAKRGITTGAFGVALDRWRGVAYLLIALIAAAVVWFNRPVTLGVVFWTLVLALVVLLIVELLRRPADEVAAEEAEAALAGDVEAEAASDDADTLVLADAVVVDTGESTRPPASPSDPARRTD